MDPLSTALGTYPLVINHDLMSLPDIYFKKKKEAKKCQKFSLMSSYDSVLLVRGLQSRGLCSLPGHSLERGEGGFISNPLRFSC